MQRSKLVRLDSKLWRCFSSPKRVLHLEVPNWNIEHFHTMFASVFVVAVLTFARMFSLNSLDAKICSRCKMHREFHDVKYEKQTFELRKFENLNAP